jgi:diguanylate cyclase (GGDEF)-like protein
MEAFLMSRSDDADTARIRRLSRRPAPATMPCASLPSHCAEVSKPVEVGPGLDENAALRYDLERVALFEGLSTDLIDAIVTQSPVRLLGAGDTLLAAGEINEHMFVVLSGELTVHLGDASSAPVATLVTGDTVGELSVIDHRPVSAHVIARRESTLLMIGESMFWRISHASHRFAVGLMLKLADRLRANNGTVQEKLEQVAKLEEVAARDALTGVQSRRWLDAMLPQLCTAHGKLGDAVSIAVVDIDHFKRINDTHGHRSGDAVLAAVAKTLRAKLRPSDHVARFGGEEFVVILPQTRLPGAQIAAERLREAVHAAAMLAADGGELPNVTVSIGLAERLDGDDAGSLLERADAALYRAKRNGRDRVES